MTDFEFQCATKIIFGKEKENLVGSEIAAWGGKNVLFVYGGQSVKKSGLFSRVTESLSKQGISYTELAGVVPNPRVSLVREGISICKQKGIDFILAVGGGSSIDTAKAISFGAKYDGDVWDFLDGTAQAAGRERIPVGTILTLPAAGSEASDSCVISDETKMEKSGFGTPTMRPVFSILNPELTFSLPPFQTVCGCTDIMAHVMERYFTRTNNVELTDRLSESILKTIIHNLPIVLDKPDDYAARAEIMWAGTLAQNDLVGTGRQQDWFNHVLEHQISGYYDIAHGAGLAISFPAWMTFVSEKPECLAKLNQYAVNVWGVEQNFENPKQTVLEGISRLRRFLNESGLFITLHEVNIGTERFEDIADRITKNGKSTMGSFWSMSRSDILRVLELAQ